MSRADEVVEEIRLAKSFLVGAYLAETPGTGQYLREKAPNVREAITVARMMQKKHSLERRPTIYAVDENGNTALIPLRIIEKLWTETAELPFGTTGEADGKV